MEAHDGAQTTTEQVTGGPSEDTGLDTKCVFCKQDVSETSEPQLLPCLHTACKLCIPTEPTGERVVLILTACYKCSEGARVKRRKYGIEFPRALRCFARDAVTASR
ncbi:hypothetical protein HPB48_009512 [Haemaphysalis longicornis]|uniref:RING-type domain-containing protein n=1 Tax=Haemaphysalis longicornis TaxID=44386 RepID=A0A9J6GE79_HAELO|nr:hypothetical protein HPB48_009512 [Haemaphysalis longicornis]